MAVAGCINAYDCAGCYLTTLQQLQSDNIGVAINYTAPGEYGRRQLDYIKYTDKCGCTCCLTGENELRIVATQGVIKNFTLTNDDTNEVVNVKWNDLFGSNRAYTMVRYKTGSYPTSITDGTLAVKETTQNQYSVSGYNVSGLTDGTTYYFTAFAVSQDGTIIVVQNKSITPDYNRKPSASTLLYYSFDNSNLNDGSGKGNNGTWYNGAGTFVDGIKGKCARISGTRGIRIPITFPTGNFTYSICAYTTNLSSPQIQSFLGTIEWGTNYGVFHFHWTSGNQIVIATSRDGTNRPTSGYMEANKRINIILTRSGNVRKIYKNGTLIFNQTISYSMSGGTWTVGCEYTDGRAINGNIDEVILENRAWTDAEVSKYVQKLGLT